jgi:AAA ATPase domain
MLTPPLSLPPFVGRERALAALHQARQLATDGHGGLVLVSGEPGIGKTRFAEEVARQAEARGARALWARSWEGDGAPAFWPWIQIVQTYASAVEPAELRRQLGAGAAEIAALVAEVASLYPDLPEPPSMDPAAARFRLFDSVTAFLRRAAVTAPLVLVLDDLHWADEASLQLLRFMSGDLPRTRILALGTYRDTEMRPGGLPGGAQHVHLEGLTRAEVAELVNTLSNRAPDATLVDSVFRRTAGNPFYVRELVRLLEDAHDADARVPEGVREVIERRLGGLSPACRALLASASVLGAEFSVERVTDLGRRTAERVRVLLEDAAATGLVDETEPAAAQFRFIHALVRDVLYDDLAPEQRQALHRRAATTLARRRAGRLEGIEAELAYHYHAAGGPTDLARALDLAELAAERSVRLLAHEHAADQLRLALELLERVDASDQRRRCRMLLALGSAHMAAGALQAARTTQVLAAAVARDLGAADLLAAAALGTQAEFTAGVVDEVEVRLLEEALAAVDCDQPALRARLLARLARALLFSPQAYQRATLAAQAVDLARQAGDPVTLAAVLYECHQALWGLPDDTPESRLEVADEIVRIADHAGESALGLQGRALRLGDLLELGDMPRLRAEYEAYGLAVRELRQTRFMWHLPLQRATLAILAGRFDEADRLIDEGVAQGRRVQHVGLDNFGAAAASINRLLQGRFAETLDAMRAGVERYPAVPAYRVGLALAQAEAGRVDSARSEFERLAAAGFADLPRDFIFVFDLALLALVCHAVDDVPRAERLRALLLPFAAYNVRVTRLGIACLGSVEHYLGLLCATLGRWDEAVTRFEAAAQFNDERLGAPPFVANSRYQLGRSLVARGRPGDAARGRATMEAALRLASASGAHVLFAAAPASSATRFSVRREGEFWTVERSEQAFRLRHTIGMVYLTRLLVDAGQEMHVLDLVSTRGPVAVGQAALPGLDAQAREAYRQRLREVAAELDEAHAWGDLERAARAQQESDLLTDELARAVGLGGRARATGSAAERARVTVTKALRSAVRRIGEHDAELGVHLDVSLRTGAFCSYRPDPSASIAYAT